MSLNLWPFSVQIVYVSKNHLYSGLIDVNLIPVIQTAQTQDDLDRHHTRTSIFITLQTKSFLWRPALTRPCGLLPHVLTDFLRQFAHGCSHFPSLLALGASSRGTLARRMPPVASSNVCLSRSSAEWLIYQSNGGLGDGRTGRRREDGQTADSAVHTNRLLCDHLCSLLLLEGGHTDRLPVRSFSPSANESCRNSFNAHNILAFTREELVMIKP